MKFYLLFIGLLLVFFSVVGCIDENNEKIDDLMKKMEAADKNNDDEMVITYADMILELKPSDTDVLFKKALSLMQLNRTKEEIAVLDRIIELNPRSNLLTLTWELKGDALYELEYYYDAIYYYNLVLEKGTYPNAYLAKLSKWGACNDRCRAMQAMGTIGKNDSCWKSCEQYSVYPG